MLRAVEIARGDGRQTGVRHTAEDLALVEQLPAVDEAPEEAPGAEEPPRRPLLSRAVRRRVRVSRDDRRAFRSCGDQRIREVTVHGNERTQADGQGVAGDVRIRVVVGQLEARDDEQVVASPRALGLFLLGHGSSERSTWSVTTRTSKPCEP